MTSEPYDAVVLAGGAAKRLGGADKPGLPVAGRAMVERVLDACAGAAVTVVVGPRRAIGRPVVWAREQPPGGGPLAALAAGLRKVTADTVLVFAADLPFLTRTTALALRAVLREPHDGAVLTDADGRDQPLTAVYRTAALRRGLALIATEHGTVAGLPLRLLTAELALYRLPDPTGSASFDCDTWDDLSAARARIREHGHVLDEWIAAAKAELGIDLDVDTSVLLDLARDAAHGVARPAAPLTTFLVGYAAALAGGGPEAVADASRKAAALAVAWGKEAQGSAGPDTATGAGGGGGTPAG
ncbi:NTP transferase domain-containing protein [Actinacidiphila oryziradicis]|jgi:molybdopterin-guanine dinucleotide biosynthesis protein A|uniref:NTP transferase domain-containing protein n=1 Tax=Actinacidiphila oryziradicis TaxID=2571141 RepID=UPI0023F2F104|nr:NTP transferase domain-containing protein [Actinacidiphila oryziradicis]MCW2869642.1 molybdenum cofactor guanylyltransferase [Actinacidiphila oryziradicis]